MSWLLSESSVCGKFDWHMLKFEFGSENSCKRGANTIGMDVNEYKQYIYLLYSYTYVYNIFLNDFVFF